MPDVPPIEVATTTGWWNLIGTWVTATGVVGVIGTVVVAWINQWGPWKDRASADRAADFERLRADVAEAKADAKAANATAQRLENMVTCMRPAITILTAEVKRLDPNPSENAALAQVNELLAMAAGNDLSIALTMARLATAQGVGEPPVV